MAFHYTRTPSDEGGVARMEGAPAGEALVGLLDGAVPPFRVALQVVASLCEIVYIAQEDSELHGSIGAAHTWVTAEGGVSLGGFGEPGTGTGAPDRDPSPAVDLYDLGRLASNLLCGPDPSGEPPPADSANAHDDHISDWVMGADLGDLGEDIANDVRWFLIYLQAFDPAERPDALRVWRSMVAFANTVPGPDLSDWATAAMQGSRDVRDVAPPPAPTPAPMGGAASMPGPLAAGMSFDRPQGSKTMYWEEDDEDIEEEDAPPQPKPTPAIGGGGLTGHWSPDDLAAMLADDDAAPKPQRAATTTEESPMGTTVEAVDELANEPEADDEPAVANEPADEPEAVDAAPPPPPPVATTTPRPATREEVVASMQGRPTYQPGQAAAKPAPAPEPKPVVSPVVASKTPVPEPASQQPLPTWMLVLLGASIMVFLVASLSVVGLIVYSLTAG